MNTTAIFVGILTVSLAGSAFANGLNGTFEGHAQGDAHMYKFPLHQNVFAEGHARLKLTEHEGAVTIESATAAHLEKTPAAAFHIGAVTTGKIIGDVKYNGIDAKGRTGVIRRVSLSFEGPENAAAFQKMLDVGAQQTGQKQSPIRVKDLKQTAIVEQYPDGRLEVSGYSEVKSGKKSGLMNKVFQKKDIAFTSYFLLKPAP
jgi:hypothetical protein